jgi:hypothetical protein
MGCAPFRLARHHKRDEVMADLIMLVLVLACFGLTQAYAFMCNGLLAVTSDRRDKDDASS